MKWKPVLCVAVLALVAGCKTSQENPYASFGEYGFSYDLSQQPVQGLTVAESERIEKAPSATPGQLLNPPVIVPVSRPSAPNMDQVAPPSAPVTPPPADSAAPATTAPAATPAPAQ